MVRRLLREAQQVTQGVLRAAQAPLRGGGGGAAGGPPEGRRSRKKCDTGANYMPENQIETKCVKRPPEPRKGVYQDAFACLNEKKRAVLIYCNSVYDRTPKCNF